MYPLGVNYCSESSVTRHCTARDHASALLPVTRHTLLWAQSELHESVITHTCRPQLKVSNEVIEINVQQSYNNTHMRAINSLPQKTQINLITKKQQINLITKKQHKLILLPLHNTSPVKLWPTNVYFWTRGFTGDFAP